MLISLYVIYFNSLIKAPNISSSYTIVDNDNGSEKNSADSDSDSNSSIVDGGVSFRDRGIFESALKLVVSDEVRTQITNSSLAFERIVRKSDMLTVEPRDRSASGQTIRIHDIVDKPNLRESDVGFMDSVGTYDYKYFLGLSADDQYPEISGAYAYLGHSTVDIYVIINVGFLSAEREEVYSSAQYFISHNDETFKYVPKVSEKWKCSGHCALKFSMLRPQAYFYTDSRFDKKFISFKFAAESTSLALDIQIPVILPKTTSKHSLVLATYITKTHTLVEVASWLTYHFSMGVNFADIFLFEKYANFKLLMAMFPDQLRIHEFGWKMTLRDNPRNVNVRLIRQNVAMSLAVYGNLHSTEYVSMIDIGEYLMIRDYVNPSMSVSEDMPLGSSIVSYSLLPHVFMRSVFAANKYTQAIMLPIWFYSTEDQAPASFRWREELLSNGTYFAVHSQRNGELKAKSTRVLVKTENFASQVSFSFCACYSVDLSSLSSSFVASYNSFIRFPSLVEDLSVATFISLNMGESMLNTTKVMKKMIAQEKKDLYSSSIAGVKV